MICDKLKLDYSKVVRLAKTKWNFINFQPGLVGGHCLPVDPYYLSYIAKKINLILLLHLLEEKQIIKWKILYLKNLLIL